VRNSVYFDVEENEDPLVECIRQRALSMQGNGLGVKVEKTRVQRYDQYGHFADHFDAEDDETAVRAKGNRMATFMLYLSEPSSGGGTIFPQLKTDFNPPDKCKIIDCSGERNNATTFRPTAGNALFWMNVHKDGRLHLDTYHAGMPVLSGVKTIMNIWLWQEWPVEPYWAKDGQK
jgi:prolyl 4-hydroxylase